MRKCPNCNEKTIPEKWVLLGKANGQKGRCYQCENCNTKIKKTRIFGFLEDILFSDIGLILIGLGLIAGFSTIFDSFFVTLILSIMTIVCLNVLINFFTVLNIADESYCRGDMSRIGAFFVLISFFSIISYMIYFFIIQPIIK